MFNVFRQKYTMIKGALGTPLIAMLLLGCGDGSLANQEPASLASAVTPDLHDQALTESCDFSGTWAVKFHIPVTWRSNIGIDGGTGAIEQWALVTRRDEDGHILEETVRPCGSVIPTYRSRGIYGGEQYGVGFPDALFDSGSLPTLAASTWLSGRAPGDSYDVPPIPLTLGIDLPSPKDFVWPKLARNLTQYLTDSDNDGQPGVTAYARDDGALVLPPVDMSKSRRARKFHIALRNLIGARGKIISCDRFEGNVIVANVGGKAAIQSTILGCELTDSSPCSGAHATLANTLQPSYQVGEGSRNIMVRVPDSTTCAEVRAQDFQ